MNTESEPLVSVITPVYNMGPYLSKCIESILQQSYKNLEYIIVNNCSNDNTLEVALDYEKRDSRIKVHNNKEFVDVITNHNIAFSLISKKAKYCKVVSADDFIFENCIKEMVKVAEANPTVGIVGSYQLCGNYIKWQGFPYPRNVMTGREICRKVLLIRDPSFGFGSPTSLLYRADIIRKDFKFYPNLSPHADTSACIKNLKDHDFGFVYQVLCYERAHELTQTSQSKKINRYTSANLDDLMQYGKFYLSEKELKKMIRKNLDEYYGYLSFCVIKGKGKEFWDYHKNRLEELGQPISAVKLIKGFIIAIVKKIKEPSEKAIKRLIQSIN